jgi:hypothetical protein
MNNNEIDMEIKRLNALAVKQKAEREHLSKMEKEVDELIKSIANWD